LFGIFSEGTGQTTISSNEISHLTNSTTESTQQSKMYGIFTKGGVNLIEKNRVHDLETGGSAAAANYENVAICGIMQSSTANGSQQINRNTVHHLSSTTTSNVECYGIMLFGSASGNDTVSGNFIHSFRIVSPYASCYLHGLSFRNGSGTVTGTIACYNNIVYLGDSITTGCSIFGIIKNTIKATNIFHNTVHLGGTVADGSTTSSFAFRDRTEGTPALRDIRNNIFYNTRSGGGSNYALYFHVLPNITIDYNDYGWSGTYFAQIYSNSQQFVTLQEWLQVMAGQDTHSLTIDPQFVNSTGTQPADFKTNVGLDGVSGTGVTLDYGDQSRSTGSPTMGAWECRPVDLYNGPLF
jgi:hypothetical protein